MWSYTFIQRRCRRCIFWISFLFNFISNTDIFNFHHLIKIRFTFIQFYYKIFIIFYRFSVDQQNYLIKPKIWYECTFEIDMSKKTEADTRWSQTERKWQWKMHAFYCIVYFSNTLCKIYFEVFDAIHNVMMKNGHTQVLNHVLLISIDHMNTIDNVRTS